MSKITVDAAHTEELKAALTAVEGRAYARTISAQELLDYAAEADRRLADLSIPEKLRSGSSAAIVGGIASAHSQWGVDCTHAVITRTPTRWILDTDSIERRFAPSWGDYLTVSAVAHEPRQRAWDRIVRNAGIHDVTYVDK